MKPIIKIFVSFALLTIAVILWLNGYKILPPDDSFPFMGCLVAIALIWCIIGLSCLAVHIYRLHCYTHDEWLELVFKWNCKAGFAYMPQKFEAAEYAEKRTRWKGFSQVIALVLQAAALYIMSHPK